MELMKLLPDKCIALVLTDPPYFRIVENEWDRQWASLNYSRRPNGSKRLCCEAG
jgi:DNA modification methylase